jgi:hypothetical protein
MIPNNPQTPLLSRRQALRSAGAGFGYLALAGLLGENARKAAAAERASPLAAKGAHFQTKAKRLIFVFMQGAVSQVGTFEYKPQLQNDGGKPGPGGGTLTASKFSFKQYGQTGSWFSELLPHMARHADKLCWLRGLHTDTPAHPQAVVQLHTGSANAALTRPSMGAWLLYGLGSEDEDLPGYVTVNPPPNFGGAVNYGSAFLPAHFQGTRITDQGYLPNLAAQSPPSLQRKQLDLLAAMNRDLAATPGAPDAVEGIIASYEMAFRMQGKIPELLDLSKEPQKVFDRYGVKPGPAGGFARQCLMARRLCEAGVRFVEICQPGWDHHSTCTRGSSTAAPPSISRPRRCWKTWNSADCSTKRWCCSAPSSGGCRPRRGRTAATTTSPATRCGWPAPASRRGSPTGRPTSTG